MAIRGVHIKIEQLCHRYSAKSPVTFEEISVEAEPGESLVIIGRSGCGKSTLLHVMAGLLNSTSGTVSFDGVQVKEPSPSWVMMFQAPHLFPWMRVSQNVGVGLRFAKWPEKKIRARVAEVLELVDLQAYANNNVQDLSGGQQQRVALARSLVMEPEVLLLDEPFSALDAFTRASLQKDVRSIAKQIGINLVMVTHDIDEAVLMADRALVMAGSPGKIRDELEVDLPDPRDREDPTVQRMRTQLMTAFHDAAGEAPAAGSENGSEEAGGEPPAAGSEDGSEALHRRRWETKDETEGDESATVANKAGKGSWKRRITSKPRIIGATR